MKNKFLQKFKVEYRFMSCDIWGDAMEAWFECAGQMNKRGLNISENWKYSPGLGSDGTDKESHWYHSFKSMKNDNLIKLGNFLFRYCQFLRYKKIDY